MKKEIAALIKLQVCAYCQMALFAIVVSLHMNFSVSISTYFNKVGPGFNKLISVHTTIAL